MVHGPNGANGVFVIKIAGRENKKDAVDATTHLPEMMETIAIYPTRKQLRTSK